MNWTLDIEHDKNEVSDTEQLRKQLLDIHQRATHEPRIVFVNAPDGSRLAVGLGSQRSVLNYIAPGGWPSRNAVDDYADEGFVQYVLAEQVTEVPIRDTVPVEHAIEAAVAFMMTGSTDPRLRWEND